MWHKGPKRAIEVMVLAFGVIGSGLCFGETSTAYSPSRSLPERLFKFQTLAAAIVGLLGASVAILAVLLSNVLARKQERRRQIIRQTELAGNLISLIEAEKQFSEKGYLEGSFFLATEVPNITIAEISPWLSSDVEANAVSMSELTQFWRGIYEESKGFPSPITDMVSFVLWAAGRAAVLAAGARQRGKDLSSTELVRTAKRIQHLLTAIGIAASDLQTELAWYIDSPRKYVRVPFLLRAGLDRPWDRYFGPPAVFSRQYYYRRRYRAREVVGPYRPPDDYRLLSQSEIKEGLSRKFLERANIVIRDKRPREPLEDRSPQVLRLILPASMIADYEAALGRFRFRSFVEKEDSGIEEGVSEVEFFQRMLDCEERSRPG